MDAATKTSPPKKTAYHPGNKIRCAMPGPLFLQAIFKRFEPKLITHFLVKPRQALFFYTFPVFSNRPH